MKVRLLNQTKKLLNSVFIIAFSLFTLFLTFFFTLQLFNIDNGNLIVFLLIAAIFFLLISILSALGNAMVRPQFFIAENSHYLLIVNSNKRVEEINSKKEIEFCGNYLRIDEDGEIVIELNNTETFKLINSMSKLKLRIAIENKQSRFLEQSPKAFFDSMMGILWAAS